MEGNRVHVEQLKQAMAGDFEQLVQEVAAAMNAARDGRIIADTEELVRDANAVFRERVYAKAVGLLQNQQEAFSPSAPRIAEQGPPVDDASDGQRASADRADDLLVGPERHGQPDRSVAGADGASVQSGRAGDGLS